MSTATVALPAYRERTFEAADLQVRSSLDGGAFTVEGRCLVYDVLSEPINGQFRERLAPGCVRKADKTEVRLLWNHDASRVLASAGNGSLTLTEDAQGVRFRASIAPTSYANDLRVLMERGDVSGVSFGFVFGQHRIEQDRAPDGLPILTHLEFATFREVSLVTWGAYPQASAEATRHIELPSHLTGATTAAGHAEAGRGGTGTGDHEPGQALAAMRERQQASRRRLSQLTTTTNTE